MRLKHASLLAASTGPLHMCSAKLSLAGNTNLRIANNHEIMHKHSLPSALLTSRRIADRTDLSVPLALSAPHCLSSHSCLTQLQVKIETGLSSDEARTRASVYGVNKLPEQPAQSFLAAVLEQFGDRLVQVLLGIATLSAVLAYFESNAHAFTEPVVIAGILVINAVVGALQSRSAESSLEALKKLQPTTACVRRNGEWIHSLPAAGLVPGDIIKLRAGDRVPADARIVELASNAFSTDESSLTGESMAVQKNVDAVDVSASIAEKSNMVFSGTVVTGGTCYAVVTATGPGTEIGRINAGVVAAQSDEHKTPLQLQMDTFVGQLSRLIAVICAGVWLASIPKFRSPVFTSQWQGAAHYAKVAVALGVAAIPEGLPAVITLCLSLGTRRMAQRNVIVRKLSSVETLGCTSVVCTDKTGTLTTNKMTVKALVTGLPSRESPVGTSGIGLALVERAVEGVSYDPYGHISDFGAEKMKSRTMQLLASICVLCNEAHVEYKNGAFERAGEPTEAALKVLAEKLGAEQVQRAVSPEEAAHQFSDYWGAQFEVLSTLEFNRDRKSMGVLVRPTRSSGAFADRGNMLFVKGASEMVTARCNRMQLEDGSIVPITEQLRAQLNCKFQDLAQRPLRCLAFAYKSGVEELGSLSRLRTREEAAESPLLKDSANFARIESDMILVGFCGIKDPARPEAAEAIRRCTRAGIRVMMITGDSKETAVAIAKDVSIFEPSADTTQHAFTGKEFFSLPEEQQLQLLKTGNKVFCRTEPADKQRLIKLLERLDEVVAMTGDGVNDAPALQQAAIGVAMGITGTEVAKSAADMVLADDNFSTVVGAVEEGRNIYANMQTFISFLISTNIGEVMTVFLATLLGIPEPLTPLHLLFVNLVTDGPAATALGFNPADPAAMRLRPRPKGQPILSRWLMVRYAITGVYVGFATIGAFVWWYLQHGVKWAELRHWGECSTWPAFLHTALAPAIPKQPCDIFSGRLRARPQSLALSVLVVIEMLKALSAVSLDHSLLAVQPWQNPWLLVGVLLPTLLHLAVLYIPTLSTMFGVAPLTKADWKVVLAFSLPILLIEEVLKLVGRRLQRKHAAAETITEPSKSLF